MKYILIFFLSITTCFAQLHVSTFGVKGDGVTDDAPALNRAIAAAILKHDKLIIPAPTNFYNIKSTLNIVPAPGQTQAWLRIEGWGHRNNFIVYTGPGNQPAVKIIGLKGGEIDGLMVRVANGISGVTCFEIGTEGASNSTGGFNMVNCDATLGNGANIGYRLGHIEGGNADISEISFIGCSAWGSKIPGQIGFLTVGRNTLQINTFGGSITGCDIGVSITAGGSQGYYGFGGSNNLVDFNFATSNQFLISGGGSRFEHGKVFVRVPNASSHPTVMIQAMMISYYTPTDGYFINFNRAGTLIMDGVKVEQSTGVYNKVKLGGAVGTGIGNFQVRGGAWHAAEPFYYIEKPGTWKVNIQDVGKLDAGYISNTYFKNTTTPAVTPPVDPPPVEPPPPTATNKFVGTYYDNVNFTGTSFTREDAKIDFKWANGSPDSRIAVDTYSVRWEGTFDFSAGAYTFTAKVDDGVRIFVDDEKILESWKDQAVATYTAVKTMTAGIHNVRVEYYENGGSAELTVDWKAGTPPVVVVPPVNPPINVVAAANAKQAIESASNTLVRIGPGTYSGAPIYVPVGVSVECDQTVFVPTAAGSESAGQKVGVLNYNSGSKTNGNQSIKGCALDGRNVGYAGIMVNNRDYITIENNTFKDFNFNGAWISNSTGSLVKGNDFYNTAWSDSRYLSGALNIFAVTNLTVDGNKFRSDKNSKGTGIEALWKESTLINLKIVNNEFRLSKHNPWNGGTSKNFAIELHDTHYRGIEIANNYFGNELSMASHKPGNGSKTWIHHNTGDLGGDTYFVETVADDFVIEDNVVERVQMFAANFQANTKWKNWIIRRNEIKNPAGVPSWGGYILIGHLGVANVLVQDNKFPAGKLIHYMRDQGGVTLVGSNQ